MLKWLQFILLILVMAETDEDRYHRKDKMVPGLINDRVGCEGGQMYTAEYLCICASRGVRVSGHVSANVLGPCGHPTA